MVERSIAWLVRRGGRKVRYRWIARNRIGLAHRCAAVNLRRHRFPDLFESAAATAAR